MFSNVTMVTLLNFKMITEKKENFQKDDVEVLYLYKSLQLPAKILRNVLPFHIDDKQQKNLLKSYKHKQ